MINNGGGAQAEGYFECFWRYQKQATKEYEAMFFDM